MVLLTWLPLLRQAQQHTELDWQRMQIILVCLLSRIGVLVHSLLVMTFPNSLSLENLYAHAYLKLNAIIFPSLNMWLFHFLKDLKAQMHYRLNIIFILGNKCWLSASSFCPFLSLDTQNILLRNSNFHCESVGY